MTRGHRDLPVATETESGLVQLALDGEVSTTKAVPGRDNRLIQRVVAFPVGAEGQVVCRTDLPGDPLYRWDGDAASWVLLGSGGSGGAVITEVEIDFGSSPVYDKTFTITDASVSGTSKIMVTPSGAAPTGLTSDEWLWDALGFAALAGSGSFTLYAHAQPGPVSGKRKILYTVG